MICQTHGRRCILKNYESSTALKILSHSPDLLALHRSYYFLQHLLSLKTVGFTGDLDNQYGQCWWEWRKWSSDTRRLYSRLTKPQFLNNLFIFVLGLYSSGLGSSISSGWSEVRGHSGSCRWQTNHNTVKREQVSQTGGGTGISKVREKTENCFYTTARR